MPVRASLQPIVRSRSELRLLVPAGALDILHGAPIIVRHARSRGVVRRLDSIYYDTADHALFGSLMSLRVQRHGRRFIQTLRQHASGQASPGLAWQAPVDSASPDLSRLAGEGIAPLAAAVMERLSSAPLMAMFETRLRRQIRCLELPGALVDVVFDEGVIQSGTRQQPLTEIRLALRSGEAGVLYDVGMRLLELAPVRVTTGSTLRLGYALASGMPPKAEKAAPSVVTHAFNVDDLIASVLAGCQSHLQANQIVAEDGRNPDGVHQMRVALRRLRSALSLLRRETPSATMLSLSTEAKWVANQLGAARSWDVFLTTTLTQPARCQNDGLDFDGLREAAEVPRAAGYAAMRAMLEAARYGRFQLSLGQWIARRGWRNEVDREGLAVLAEPASAMVIRVLTRLHRKALRQGAHFRRLSPTQRHELRITLKKLRYALEFFLPLLAEPGHASRFLRRLSGLQDALGLDHDAATTQPLLDEIGQASRSPEVHQAIGVVIGWQARDRHGAGATLVEQWRRFKELPLFWTRPSPS
jgi:triphosphatase